LPGEQSMVKKISIYQEVELQSKVTGASPHRLVQLLYESALTHLQLAHQLLRVVEPEKDQSIMLERSLVKALNIVLELRDALDLTVGSELPHNLDLLYDYIQRRLLHARIKKDTAAVMECMSLLETLKSGWDAIGQQSP
jgi:flagellar secretion chaperone FliS